jgi:hypothetical protein
MISASDIENLELMDQIYKHTNFPTFQEFSKNPEKWRKNPEDAFECLDLMDTFFKSRIASRTLTWRGKYKCKSTEELQKVTKEEGYRGTDLDFIVRVTPKDGTSNLYNSKVHVTIDMYSKIELRLMGKVVAND